MNEMLPMMRRAAERTGALTRGLSEEQLALPTPCEKYDVRTLIAHLEWAVENFASVASGGEKLPREEEYHGDFPERAARMLAAWERPEAWEGVSAAMGLPMPVLANMALVDIVAHGWDLAVATGRDYEVDEETATAALAFTEQMAPMGRKRGAFADPVEVPEDAATLHRLLGIIGRDPSWR
ncbi:TIGR03086 family metal-binding protein [Nonomuraea sp. NPDC050536]|uniref:TIGR03086 family metal-binding protein n=1 Tax=Nonomuraea sp. NPDC050536 TaxID=3364366 RepID=UPI0037C71197